MNISDEIAKMSDAQLAEVCGGTEPARKPLFDSRLQTEQQFNEHTMVRLLSGIIGEDTTRGGLLETPARAMKAWQFWTKGYQENPADIFKVFEDGAGSYDDQVGVFNIPFYSHCEHHLAPIIGHASIAYVPDGKIVGLSKLNRIVECFARRLQVQERLTSDIADAIQTHLDPKGVAVFIKARHLCMESRGICQQGHFTITQRFRGCFATDQSDWRREFLAQCR